MKLKLFKSISELLIHHAPSAGSTKMRQNVYMRVSGCDSNEQSEPDI